MIEITRPIGYRVPTFIESATATTVSASQAMAEWKMWIDYVNRLEADKAQLIKVLKDLTTLHERYLPSLTKDAEKLLTEMEGK